MKNNLFEDENGDQKPFFLGYMVFGTFLKRWPKRLKVLQKRMEEQPSIAAEIDAAIKNTTASIENFKKAAKDYKEAAKNAKEQYDNQSGIKGKVKGFFGLEQGDPDKKIFNLDGDDFVPGNVYSMNDILSPDFNIGLFLEQGSLEGPRLKTMVMNDLLGFRKFYDPKTSKKISIQQLEIILDKTLDDFDPFESFKIQNNESMESILQEAPDNFYFVKDDTIAEIKNICKPKAETAFAKFQESIKNNPTQINILKQRRILINNPYYAIYRGFKDYGDNTEQILERFPELLNSVMNKIHVELYGEKIETDEEQIKTRIEQLKGDPAGFYNDFASSPLFATYFSKDTPSQRASAEEEEAEKKAAEKKELDGLKKSFDSAVEKRLKELQKGIPLIIPGEKDELTGDLVDSAEPYVIDAVYRDDESAVMRWSERYAAGNLFTSKQINDLLGTLANKLPTTEWHDDHTDSWAETEDKSIKDILTYGLKIIDRLIKARDNEARRDLTALAAYMKEASSDKIGGYGLDPKLSGKITNTLRRNNNEAILKLYKYWHDWMEKNKKDMLRYFEQNTTPSEEALEEQIIKLIKPLLREKFKRKQNGKKNLCN